MKIDLESNYEKNKVILWVGGIFCACVLVFLLVLFWWNQRIMTVDVSHCEIDRGQLTYEVTKTYGMNFIKLEGYAYVPGQSISYADIKILAYNAEEDKYYEIPTESVKNTSVTKKADDGHNYDYSGFSSIVLAGKMWDDAKFFIRCRNNGMDILADTGEMFDYK